jgi:hypothetical protein
MSIVPKNLLNAHVVVLCTAHNNCGIAPYVEGSKPYDYHACTNCCSDQSSSPSSPSSPCSIRIMQIIGKTAEGRMACLRNWAPLHQWNFKKYTNNMFEFKHFAEHTDDPVFKTYFECTRNHNMLYF